MTVDIDSVRILTDSIKAATERKPDGSTVSATVTETGSNVAWVRIDGSSGDTPVTQSTVSVSVGDRVSVRIENGSATITGNLSNVSTGAAETRAAVEPVKAVAESAEQAAERATDYASTAKNAAQSAVQSAVDAGRAAAVAQAAMGSTTVDWHDYTVNVGEDGQWHVFDKEGAEVPLSEISMVYQDALGLHVLGDGTRLDIGSSAVEVFDTNSSGESVARFGAGGARVGTEDKAHTNISRNMFSIIGDDGNPTFQAEKGIVVIGNPYDNVQRFSADGFGFYKYTGTATKWKQINTESDSSYTLVYIKSGTAWAEDDCLNVEITGNVQIPTPRDGDPSLTEVNPLVLEIDGEQALVNAEIGRPKHVVENGARRTQWDITWRYATNKSVSVSLSSEEQLGEIFKFSKPVSGGYIFESIRAYLLKPTYEKTFSVSSDGLTFYDYPPAKTITAHVPAFTATAGTSSAFGLTRATVTIDKGSAYHPGDGYVCAGIVGAYQTKTTNRCVIDQFYVADQYLNAEEPVITVGIANHTTSAVSYADGNLRVQVLWIRKELV